MGVGAVHDGKIAGVLAFAVNAIANGTDHSLSLLTVIFGNDHGDFFAFFADGLELFVGAVFVAVNDCHRAIQNILAGAIVLLKQENFGFLEIFFETVQVAVIRATPAVNALIFITNYIKVVVRTGKVFEDGILRQVGVLELVNQNMLKFVRIGFTHDGILVEQLGGVNQHVVKIHGVVFDEAFLVDAIQALSLLVTEAGDREFLRCDELVFSA